MIAVCCNASREHNSTALLVSTKKVSSSARQFPAGAMMHDSGLLSQEAPVMTAKTKHRLVFSLLLFCMLHDSKLPHSTCASSSRH